MENIEELLRAKFGAGRPKGNQHPSSPHEGRKNKSSKNLYKVLEVEPSATEEAIHKAYKELAKKAKGEKLAEIEEAYSVLSNKEKRQAYDKGDHEEAEDDGVQNLFDMLSGGGMGGRMQKPKKSKMKPMQFALEATLDEIFSGATSKMRVTRMRLCKDCSGKGCKPGTHCGTCESCDGKKMVMKVVQVRPGMYAQTRAPCDACQGIGRQ